MKNTFYIIFILLGISICFSCSKTNVDEMTPEEEEIEQGTVICELILELSNDDGLLTANASDGTEPYSYSWSTQETSSSIRVEEDGIYSVEVVDADGCIVSGVIEVVLTSPCADFNFDIDYDSDNSSLSAIVSGGTQPYVYEWSTGETTDKILINGFGVYAVTVTDDEGCVVSDRIEIGSDPCANFDAELRHDQGDGSISIFVTGGTAPYSYTWASGEVTDRIIVTGDGTYSVTITDAAGCTVVKSLSIGNNPCDNFTALFEYDAGKETLTVIPSGGTVPYNYRWASGESTATINVVSGNNNTYTVEIFDAAGCGLALQIVIP